MSLDVARLLPHAPPMRLVEGARLDAEGSLRAWATLRSDCPFATPDGDVDLMLCVELVAQAAAVLASHPAVPGEPPRSGLLVGCREGRFEPAQLRVGDTLEVEIERVAGHGDFGTFRGAVTRGAEAIAELTLAVLRAEGAT